MSDTITTPEALDALPESDVLLLASGRYPRGGTFHDCWVRPVPPWITSSDERVWEVLTYGDGWPHTLISTGDITSANVLFRPDAPTPTPAVRTTFHNDECPFGCPHFDEPTPAGDDPVENRAALCLAEHPEDGPGMRCVRFKGHATPTPAGDDQREALAHQITPRVLEALESDHPALFDEDGQVITWHVIRETLNHLVRPSAPTVTTEQREAMARDLYVAIYGTSATDQFPEAVQSVGGRLAGIALAALGIEVTPTAAPAPTRATRRDSDTYWAGNGS